MRKKHLATLRVKCKMCSVACNEVTKDARWLGKTQASRREGCSTPLPCRRKGPFRKDVDRWQRQSAGTLHDRTDWGDEYLWRAVILKRRHRRCYRRAGTKVLHLDRPVPRLERASLNLVRSIASWHHGTTAKKQILIAGRDRTCQSKQKHSTDLSYADC